MIHNSISKLLVICLALFFTLAFSFNTFATPSQANPNAPEQLAHWNKVIGSWTTTEESLKRDGTGWAPSKGALWNFYWAMDGWAIRDEYFSPPLNSEISDPNKRQIGTNIRVFNQEKNEWIMAWITKTGQSVDVYSAKSDGKTIVMYTPALKEGAQHKRITFFDIKDNSFEWKMEFSKDGKTNWLEVHRIHAIRN